MNWCFENSIIFVSGKSDNMNGIFDMILFQYLMITSSCVLERLSGLTISKGFIDGSLNLSLDLAKISLYRLFTAFLNWVDLLNMYRCAHSWVIILIR